MNAPSCNWEISRALNDAGFGRRVHKMMVFWDMMPEDASYRFELGAEFRITSTGERIEQITARNLRDENSTRVAFDLDDFRYLGALTDEQFQMVTDFAEENLRAEIAS